ncbi:MAG: PKD domain-containing protein [Bacteroidia bacterium]|nr:PKD domain-containing protein [Bacteroidia bacterium]
MSNFSIPNSNCANSILAPTNSSLFKAGTTTYGWKLLVPSSNSLLTFSDTISSTPSITFPDNQLSIDTIYTIRLRVTSVDGCIHDTTKNISILRRPLVQFTVPPTFCGPSTVAISNNTSNVGSNWLWSVEPNASASFSNISTQNPNLSFNQNNGNDSINYSIKLIATRIGTGCLDSLTRLVTIYPKPQAQFTTITQDSCGPRWVRFTNTSNPKNAEPLSSMSFVWSSLSNNHTSINDSGFFVNSTINDSTYSVSLIATSKHGCKDTFENSVVVKPNAKAVFTASSIVNCAPFYITPKITPIAFPNANSNYYWYANDSLIGSNLSFPNFYLNNANDSVLIKLKAISKNGCKDDSMEIWFRTIPNPVPAFTTSADTGCSALTVNFTNTSSPGVSSAWTFSNGASTGAGNPFPITFVNPSNTANASYTAKLVITAGSGCKDSISKSILVYPKPLANFSIPNSNCANSILAPTNSSLFKAGTTTYGWKLLVPSSNSLLTFSDTISSTPSITFPDNQLSIDTIYTIRLRVTSVDGCIHDTTRNISILRRPLAQFTVPPTFCGPSTVAINNNTTNVGSNWLWSVEPNSSASFSNISTQNPNLSFNQNNGNDSINYSIKLIATRTGTGCLDSLTRLVTIYPKPLAQFTTITQDSCGPRWVRFTNISNPKNAEPLNSMSFVWSSLSNNHTSINDSGFFVNSTINDSTYSVSLIATSKHGCKDTFENSVVVKPNAKAVFTRLIGTSCAPFNITSSNISAQAFINANNTYEWYRNGIYLGSGLTFPGTSIPNQADSGLIKLKAISKNGCKNDSMEMWFYTIENPKPNFVSIDSITCSGTNIQFINLSIPTTGLTYRWELGGTNNIVSSKNTNFTFYNYGISDTTINIKLVTLAGGTGCLDSISKQLIIKPLPNPDFGLSDTFLCYPKLLLANNISTQIPPINNTSFRWFINPLGVGISNDTSNSQVAISFPDNQSGVSKYYQITLTAESNFGCIDSVQKNVRIPSRPITNFKFNIDSSCGPISITTNNQSQYSGVYQWSSLKLGPTITNPSNLNTSLFFPAHFGLVDSIYPIKLITTNIDGCRDTLIKPFLVFPNPISMFSSSLDSGCAPLPIDFFSESIVKKPANYIWNFGDGTSLNTNIDSATHSYSGSIYRDTLFISSLISTSVNGCRDTVSKPINVLSGAVANITLEDTLICSNASNPSKLKIINSSFGSVDTFYWDFGDGTTLITTEDSIIFKPFPFEGTYTITLKAVNTCRTSYDTANVTVQVPPTVEISKTDSVGCSPLDVTFTSQSNNVYRASYFWTFGNGNTSISAIPPIQTYLQSLTTDTFYYIRLNVSNVCGNFPKFDTVRILPKPTAIFLSNTLIGCSPLEIYLSNFSVGIPQEIKWYFGNGDSSNRFNLDYPYKPIIYRTIDTPTVYKIRLIVSNICGIDSMSKYITVLPNTVKSFFSTDVQDGCESLVVKFKDLSYGGANIHWNFGDGGTSADSSPVHTFSSPGSYKVRQYVNNNCSYDTSSVMIYVYPKPKFTITKTIGNICINQSVQFNSNLTDSGSIIWHFGDGDSSTFYNPTHKYLSPGKKVFTATLTSNFNTCKNTIKDSLTIYDLPIISIASDSIRGCLNQTFNFEAISNYNHFYSWDFGDSNIAVGQKSNYVFKNPGTYTIKLVATSIQGCIDSTTKQIEVYPIPTALFDYSPRDTCNGPAWVSFNNLSIGGNAYWWDFGNGNTSTNTNSVQFYDGIAKYKIQLVTSNAYNCYDTTEHFFEIFSKPVPDFSIETKNYCIGDSIKFTNKSKLSKTYFWDFGDGNYSTLENPTHKYDTVGTYSIKLIAFAGLVCADSITKTSAITIHPPPDASFIIESADPNKPFRTFRFSANSKNQLRYFWDFEKGETGTGQTIIFTYDEIDTLKCRLIYLTVSSDYGCMDTSEQKICLEPYWNGLYVPNAFTPDYGLGDVRIFNPIGIELKSYHLKIFNKWGEIIWESTALIDGKPAVGWDGINMKDGSNCLPGSYIWTIEATFTNGDNWPGMLYPGSKKPAKKGNVTLIR